MDPTWLVTVRGQMSYASDVGRKVTTKINAQIKSTNRLAQMELSQRQANSAQVHGNTSAASRGRGRGNLARGLVRLTHMDAVQADAAADVVTDNLLIPSAVGLVLFDPGATHSFISRQFVETHRLEHSSLAKTVEVHSPGGLIIVEHACHNRPILKM